MKDFFIRSLGHLIVDPETLHAYRTSIPSKLTFQASNSDGKIIIKITSIDDTPLDSKTLLMTQASKQAEVIPMVNDLIMEYKDIPPSFRKYFEKDFVLEGKNTTQTTLVKV